MGLPDLFISLANQVIPLSSEILAFLLVAILDALLILNQLLLPLLHRGLLSH